MWQFSFGEDHAWEAFDEAQRLLKAILGMVTAWWGALYVARVLEDAAGDHGTSGPEFGGLTRCCGRATGAGMPAKRIEIE